MPGPRLVESEYSASNMSSVLKTFLPFYSHRSWYINLIVDVSADQTSVSTFQIGLLDCVALLQYLNVVVERAHPNLSPSRHRGRRWTSLSPQP